MRFTRGKAAAVLGCGPAGLFAAHALAENGWQVKIFSKKRPSHLYGAQYLHAPIPGLTDGDPIWVNYSLDGDAETYRQKVYGSMPVKVSPEALEIEHQAWDLRQTYRAAWDRYSDLIVDQPGIDAGWMGMADDEEARVMLNLRSFNQIVSTIPLPSVCYKRDLHQFHAVGAWAYGDAPDRGQFAPYRPLPGHVECSGSRDVGWYRASNVYDHVTMEWPADRKPPLPGVAEVTKPIYTDCNCYRDGRYPVKFLPLGRYGQWSKSVLTHHAYTQAAQL